MTEITGIIFDEESTFMEAMQKESYQKGFDDCFNIVKLCFAELQVIFGDQSHFYHESRGIEILKARIKEKMEQMEKDR